ncbi:hypothetical protein K501DRAFT_268845 [Backusella circina FSU 941]|nr:hypothetical protein K501DRAFT_268845 [Backusella circina FSU 941]
MSVAPEAKGVGVLPCSKCGIIWNRDLNAARNMRIIANIIWSRKKRPQIYRPIKKSVLNPSTYENACSLGIKTFTRYLVEITARNWTSERLIDKVKKPILFD